MILSAVSDSIVEFAELGKFIDTPLRDILAECMYDNFFAVAAHLQPEILIIDEVLAVGDAGFQKRCIGKMKDVSRSGRTVLFVSHQCTSSFKSLRSGDFAQNGKIEYSGNTESTIQRYLDENVKSSYQRAGQRSDRTGSGSKA